MAAGAFGPGSHLAGSPSSRDANRGDCCSSDDDDAFGSLADSKGKRQEAGPSAAFRGGAIHLLRCIVASFGVAAAAATATGRGGGASRAALDRKAPLGRT